MIDSVSAHSLRYAHWFSGLQTHILGSWSNVRCGEAASLRIRGRSSGLARCRCCAEFRLPGRIRLPSRARASHKHADVPDCTPDFSGFFFCVLRDKTSPFITSVKGVEDIRREIATLLLRKTDDLSDLCY
ncbi:hypothetical protein MHYP_G00150890 [Metynnis hypsauchen]